MQAQPTASNPILPVSENRGRTRDRSPYPRLYKQRIQEDSRNRTAVRFTMPDHVPDIADSNPVAFPDSSSESSMENDIARYKMHQENERLKQEVDQLRASQGRKTKYHEATSSHLNMKAMADTIHHNIFVTRIKALLLQTRIAILTSNNAAAIAAISSTSTLLDNSSSLAIPVPRVLRARCTFWHGMFFHKNKEYANALECFNLATEPLLTVELPAIGTPSTAQKPQLPEGAFEAGRIKDMGRKAELEVSRTPATATTAVVTTPATARGPILDLLKEERELPLSARLWRQTSHSSLADELSSLGDRDSSDDEEYDSGDEYNSASSSLLQSVSEEHQLGVMSLPLRYARPGSSASMTSVSSNEHNLAERRHVSKPADLTLAQR